jgi:hypothetical protein
MKQFRAVPKVTPAFDPSLKISMESSFPILCKHFDLILISPKLFWSIPPNSRTGFSFGGSFEVPLGIWILAWKRGIGVNPCIQCGGKAFALYSAGAMSLGTSQGFCSEYGKAFHNKSWSPGTWVFLRKEIDERKKALGIVDRTYPEGLRISDLVELIKG